MTFTVTIVGLATVVDGVGLGDSVTARHRDRLARAVRARRRDPEVRRPAGGAAEPARALRAQERRARLLVGDRRRRGARLRLRAVRGPGPRRRRLGQRRLGAHRRRRAGLRARLERRPARARADRPPARRVRLRGPALSRVLGAVMVLTAVAMAFQLDIRFQTAIADHLPAALVNPTQLDRDVDARCPIGSRSCGRPRRTRTASSDRRPSSRTSARRRTSPATTAGSTASRSRSPALRGPRRADRLLDLHVHQLHPHAAASRRVGQGVPRRRG